MYIIYFVNKRPIIAKFSKILLNNYFDFYCYNTKFCGHKNFISKTDIYGIYDSHYIALEVFNSLDSYYINEVYSDVKTK